MKSKLLALLLTLMMCCSMLLLASCGGSTDNGDDNGSGNVDADSLVYTSVYNLYVDYAKANSITPVSYETWLGTIQGADGIVGINGIVPKVRINAKNNDWEISYDGGNVWSTLGFKAATASIPGVVDIAFSSVEEDGKIYLVITYWMSNSGTASSLKVEIGTVSAPGGDDNTGNEGGETPDQPGEGGGETPDQPGEGGGETPDQPGEGGGETPDQPGEGGGETPDQPGEGGETPEDITVAKSEALSAMNSELEALGKWADINKYSDAYAEICAKVENASTSKELEAYANEFRALYETIFGEFKFELVGELEEVWAEFRAMGDVSAYEEAYSSYSGALSAVTNLADTEQLIDEINDFLDEVYEAINGSGNEDGKPSIVKVTLINNNVTYEIGSATSFSELLGKNGTVIEVVYSDGTGITVSITSDMFYSGLNQDIDVPGTYEFGLIYTDENGEMYKLSLFITSVGGNEGGETPDESLNETKEKALSEINEKWAYLGEYVELNNYEDSYNVICSGIENAKSVDEINGYAKEFTSLYETVIGDVRILVLSDIAEYWAEFKAMGDVSSYEGRYESYVEAVKCAGDIVDLFNLAMEITDFFDEVYESLKGNEGDDPNPPAEDIENAKKEALSYMAEEWSIFCDWVDIEPYAGAYANICAKVQSAMSQDELNSYIDEFKALCETMIGELKLILVDELKEVWAEFSAMGDVSAYEKEYSKYLIDLSYVNNIAELENLVDEINDFLDEVYESLKGNEGDDPNPPIVDDSVIDTSAMNYFTALGVYGIKLYDNGTYAFIAADGSVYDQEAEFYYYNDTTLVIYFHGMIAMVLTVYPDGSAKMFYPMGDAVVLGAYYMEVPMPDGSTARSTYNVLDYYINGMNVIYAYGPVGTMESLTYADLTFLGELDLAAGTLSYAGMTLYINADGSLSTSRPGEGGDDALDSYKSEAIYDINYEWNYLSQYVELDDYESEYKYIHESIINASSVEEVNNLKDQFYGLYNRIISDIKIMLQQQMEMAWIGFNQQGDITYFYDEYNDYFNRVSYANDIEELVELVDLISDLFDRIDDYLNGNQGGEDDYDAIMQLVNDAWDYFYSFNATFGYAWEETYYSKAYDCICNIEYASTLEEAEAYYHKFIEDCDAWVNNFTTEDRIQNIEISSHSADFTQGVSADEVIQWILNNVYATVYFTDGSSIIISLTEDMIMGDLPETLDDLGAYYELNIGVSYDYLRTNFYFEIRLNPDVSDFTVVGNFKRGEGDIDYLFGFANITLYDNRIALVEDYDGDSEYFEYFTYGDEIISIRVDGVEVYYSVDRENGVFWDYVYSENVIGEYEVYDEGTTLIFMGDYVGSGYYFVKYGGYVSESCFDFVTVEMYLDLESGIIIFFNQEIGILEDGKTVDTIVSEERKNNYASYVINEWNNYSPYYDLSELAGRYEALLAELYSLKYNHELDKWRDEREEFLSELYDFVNGNQGGDENEKVYLVKAYLAGWYVSIPQYAGYGSTAEILNANGVSICYEYSDGSCYYGPVTEDMITSYVDTSVAGSYVFAVEIKTEAGVFMGSVCVEVYPVETPDDPDIPGEDMFMYEYYVAEGDYFRMMGASSIRVYSNNTLRLCGKDLPSDFDGVYLPFEYHFDNVVAVLLDGEYIMLCLNGYDMKAYIYVPSEESVIGTYSMNGFGYQFIVTVYDEYFNGQNITTQYGPIGTGFETYITSLSYLDLGENTLTFGGFTYYILEGGILSESKDGEMTVVEIYLSQNNFQIYSGESVGEALERVIEEGLTVYIRYSNGTVDTVPADMSMFYDYEYYYIPSVGEELNVYFIYRTDAYGYGTSVWFYNDGQGGEDVTPDVPKDFITYTFTENTHVFYSLALSNSSNRGSLNTYDGTIELYYCDCGDYIEVDVGVVKLLFAIDREGLTVYNYRPDYSTARSYYLKEDGTYMLFDVLGEYHGADWYICYYYADVSGIVADCTIMVWLDLDSSILRTADYDEVTFYINANGSLTFANNGGSGNEENEEIKNLVEIAWSEFYNYVNKFGYDFENMYYAAAKEYIYRIENASSYAEAKEYYNDFRIDLKDWSIEFGGGTASYINYIELNTTNAEFVQGVTSYEVLEWIVNNVTATVYYSDGSTEIIGLTYDMISNYLPEVLYELDAYYEVEININYNGYGSYRYFRINLAPDLSDVPVIGTFVRAEYDIDYLFEFAVFTIYDNGILRVEDYDGDSEYFEYCDYSDNVLYINLDGVDCYYSLDFESGLFTDYKPEGGVIGEYVVLGANLTLTFIGEYTGAGEYFVYYCMSYNGLSDSVTIQMYLDIESCTIVFLDQQLEIMDGKYVVTPVSESHKEDAREYLVSEWDYYNSYYDLSELYERYNQLLYTLAEIKYEHQFDEWYDLREEFLQDMYRIINGGVNDDVQMYIEEMANYYWNLWNNFTKMYGDAVFAYESEFYDYMECLKGSDSINEAKKYAEELDRLCAVIEKEYGGMGGGNVDDGNHDDDGWTDTTDDPTVGADEIISVKVAEPIPYLGHTFTFYGNGYVAIYGEYGTSYAEYEAEGDNLILIDYYGTLIVYVIDFEEGMAYNYYAEITYGPYTEYDGETEYERLYIYGEYCGAGEYFALYEMCEDGMVYQMSIIVYFNLEKMIIDLGPTLLHFDEYGNIYEVEHGAEGDEGESSNSGDSAMDGDYGSIEIPSINVGDGNNIYDANYGEGSNPNYSYDVNYGEGSNPNYSYDVNFGETTINPDYSYNLGDGSFSAVGTNPSTSFELVYDEETGAYILKPVSTETNVQFGDYTYNANGDSTAEYIYFVNDGSDELKYSYVTVK